MKQLFASLALVLIMMGAGHGVQAQDDTASEPALQIDLEALEGLNPARQDKEAAPTTPVTPAPPAYGQEAPTPTMPEATTGPGPIPEAAPQAPDAPRPDVVSTAPAGKRTAASLRDKIIPILFQPDSHQISLKASTALDDIVELVRFKGVRLQLMAYAGKSETSQSTMRRLALQRAIAVRGYLMSRGIEGSRIDVRPQGVATDNPKERVDIIFLPQ
jgi:outer membrane protein OmpA-like peptidoglycan-associated protein